MVWKNERAIDYSFSKLLRGKQEIAFNDLRSYLPWLKNFYADNLGPPKTKSVEEVTREFNVDKWGYLLACAKEMGKNLSLERLDDLVEDPLQDRVFAVNGNFFLGKASDVRDVHLSLYASVLRPYLKNASCLVELGAGYGSKLFHLSNQPGFETLPLLAGDFTESGCELISLIGSKLKKNVTTAVCDLTCQEIFPLPIPRDAIIFTSYAAHYSPKVSPYFIDFFESQQPVCVVHFEPLYEAHSDTTPYGSLCRKYIIQNNYTLNILSALTSAFEQKKINYNLSLNVIAENPLLPISVIEWSP